MTTLEQENLLFNHDCRTHFYLISRWLYSSSCSTTMLMIMQIDKTEQQQMPCTFECTSIPSRGILFVSIREEDLKENWVHVNCYIISLQLVTPIVCEILQVVCTLSLFLAKCQYDFLSPTLWTARAPSDHEAISAMAGIWHSLERAL